MTIDLSRIHFDAQGLIPAVAQDAASGAVLLLAFMNAESLQRTITTGEAYFWSRSRAQLWHKGAQSGNTLSVKRIAINCEANSLLLTVRVNGPGACHDGYASCYYRELAADGSFTSVAERTFDPAVVYEMGTQVMTTFRALYDGYTRLRDEDFTATSETSRRLRDPNATPTQFLTRADEELQELAGVIYGTHQHTTRQQDIILEASQSAYWLILAALTSSLTYDDWQPDRPLLAGYRGAVMPGFDDEGMVAADRNTIAALYLWLHRLGVLLAIGDTEPTVPLIRDLAALNKRLA